MPYTYTLREQVLPTTTTTAVTTETRTEARTRTATGQSNAGDDIVLSDLVRGTGEASRLRRRGALRGERLDHAGGGGHAAAAGTATQTTATHAHATPHASASSGWSTTRPSRWEVFAPYEIQDEGSVPQSQALQSPPPPQRQAPRPRFQPPSLHYHAQQVQPLPFPQPSSSLPPSSSSSSRAGPLQTQAQAQQPPLVLPFPVAPAFDLDLGARRIGGGPGAAGSGEYTGEEQSSEYAYVLTCGGYDRHSESSRSASATSSASCSFVPSILPLFPPRSSLSTAPTVSKRKPGNAQLTNGCGAVIHTKAAPRPKLGMWTAKTEAEPVVVHLDACYFDSSYVSTIGKMVKSTCGCFREGVGCAVCGNPLGTVYIPCKTATEGLFTSRSRSSQQTQPHSSTSETPDNSSPKLHIYSFFTHAVSSSPSFHFPSSPSSPLPPTVPTVPSSPSSSSPSSPLSDLPNYPTYRSIPSYPLFPPVTWRSTTNRPPSGGYVSPPVFLTPSSSPPFNSSLTSSSSAAHTTRSYPQPMPLSPLPSPPPSPPSIFSDFPRTVANYYPQPPPHPHPVRSFPHLPTPPLSSSLTGRWTIRDTRRGAEGSPSLSSSSSSLSSSSSSEGLSSNEGDVRVRVRVGTSTELTRDARVGAGRPMPMRRPEYYYHPPPPVPMERTGSVYGQRDRSRSGGASGERRGTGEWGDGGERGDGRWSTGFFFGREATASPIPLSDGEDDESRERVESGQTTRRYYVGERRTHRLGEEGGQEERRDRESQAEESGEAIPSASGPPEASSSSSTPSSH